MPDTGDRAMDPNSKQRDVEHPADQQPNDTLEKMIRDPVVYEGKTVSYVKDVGTHDEGYDATLKQVLIQHPDGGTEVVPESAIMKRVAPAGPEGRDYVRPDQAPKPLTEQPEIK